VAWLRKEKAGGDSFGHVWPEDGSVIEVADDLVASLVEITDARISVVDAPEPVEEPDGDDDGGQEPGEGDDPQDGDPDEEPNGPAEDDVADEPVERKPTPKPRARRAPAKD
jgi:hypothetical protein